MADLAKTSTQWKDDFFRRFLVPLQILHILRDLKDRFQLERTRARNLSDFNGNFTAITLTGVNFGTNTSDRGVLYVRVTGSGPYTATLYKATGGGGGDAVASGSASAGADITLTASNSSGLTGTITLAGSVTAETDDVHQIAPYLDFKKHLLNVFASDGTTDKDTQARNEYEDLLRNLASQIDSMKSLVLASLARNMTQFSDGTEGYGAEFLLDGSASLVSSSPQLGGSGEVTRLYQGIMVALRLAMADDSNEEQDVERVVVAGAAGVFASGNDGQGTVASHTPSEHCPAGRHTFTCTQSDVGAEQFRHDFVPSDGSPDGRFSFQGLTVGQSYTGPRGFGPITLSRTLAKTGDGSDLNLDPASAHTVTGETDNNTDGGTLYWKIVANSSNWDISFYNSSNRTAGDLVAKVENVATDAAYTATPKNGSGLTVVGVVGSGPTSTTTGTLDLQTFKAQNASEVPDSFYVDTTVTAGGGEIQTIVAEEIGYFLNSETAGSETISDDLLKANTFEDYATSA